MTATLPVHTRLAGRYEILSLLGRGGMARVYAARDLATGSTVAVKVLDPAADAGERLSREVWNAARLDHPGCVRILDVGDGALPFLVMELVTGPTLRTVIDERGPFPMAEACAITRDIARALAHAHAAGVLHRDIKPANVILADRGAVVIDFGLSQSALDDPLTALGHCVGSPSYVAPERLAGHPYDGRADIYSTGILLYELLAGYRPYIAESAVAVAQLHLTAPVPDITAVRADVPPTLVIALDRALAKDPGDRFALAAGLASALEDIAATADLEDISTAKPARAISPVPAALLSSATMPLSLSDSAVL